MFISKTLGFLLAAMAIIQGSDLVHGAPSGGQPSASILQPGLLFKNPVASYLKEPVLQGAHLSFNPGPMAVPAAVQHRRIRRALDNIADSFSSLENGGKFFKAFFDFVKVVFDFGSDGDGKFPEGLFEGTKGLQYAKIFASLFKKGEDTSISDSDSSFADSDSI